MKTNRGIVHLFLLVIVIIVAIGAIGYLAYQNAQLRQQDGETTTTPESSGQQAGEPTEFPETDGWKTYTNKEHQFSFDYPKNLKPYELSNGVVTFLPMESFDACVAAEGSKDLQAYKPCNTALFNYSGFKKNPEETYEEYSEKNKVVASLTTFQDDNNRIWNSGLELGQVYNFIAYSEIDNTPFYIALQYGFSAKSKEEVLTFFNQILSTFKFLNIPFETVVQNSFIGGLTDKKDYVIRNENDWQNLWNKIYEPVNPKPKIEDINFDKEIILAVSQGTQKSTGYSINIVKILEEENFLQVEVEETSPRPGGIVGGALTQPYHVVKTKKTNKEVKFIY